MLSFATFLKTFKSFQSSKDFPTVSCVPEAQKVFLNTLSTSLSSIGVPSRQVSTSGWFCAQQTRKYKESLKSFSIIFSLFPFARHEPFCQPTRQLNSTQPASTMNPRLPAHWRKINESKWQINANELASALTSTIATFAKQSYCLLAKLSPN